MLYNDHHEAYKLKSVRIELGSTLCRVTRPTGKLERTNDIVPEINLYAEGDFTHVALSDQLMLKASQDKIHTNN